MKTIFLSLALTLLSLQSSGAGVFYGPVTNSNNGHIYYLLTISTWTQAQAEAQSLGGNLATINDQLEDLWVSVTFASYQSQPRQLWIGLTDQATEGEFVWIDGEPVTYTNWGTGEPNNAAGNENYTVVFASTGNEPGKWNDLANGVLSYGVVEVLPPLALSIRASEVAISWLSDPNKSYQVQFKDSASDPTWENLGPVQSGTGESIEYKDPATEPERLYQVVEVP